MRERNNILVACNNRNKEWCPYGTDTCECDVYYPHEYKKEEDKYYTCTDENDKERQCYLENASEDLNPVKELFHVQCAACGYKNSEEKFYNSSVHSKFKICPICGTVKFVCEENRPIQKEQVIKLIRRENEVIIFWVFWILLTGGCVFGFYYIDNKWLE